MPNSRYSGYQYETSPRKIKPEHENPQNGLKERVVQFDADDNTHPPIIVQRKIQKKSTNS